MGSFVAWNLYGLTLFAWVVSGLTISINNEELTDGMRAIRNSSSVNDYQPSSSVVHPPADSINPTKVLPKFPTTSSVLVEGGSISLTSTSPTGLHVTTLSESVKIQDPTSKEVNDTSAVSKNVQSKISPRKGAGEPLPTIEKTIQSPIQTSINHNSKPVVEPSITSEVVHISPLLDQENASTPKLNVNSTHINVTSDISVTEGTRNATTPQTVASTNSSVKPSPTTSKHKPKPTVTMGDGKVDKPIPPSPTRTLPIGMPRKIDYIIPIVITVVALPLLGTATFMVYRRGRDCWDKRHYRRMDFLIDGMYND